MRYRGLLSAGGVIGVLWLLRLALTQANRLGYLLWNVFLAVVPLLLVPVFGYARRRWRGRLRQVGLIGLGLVWLLFLPNAFYLLTDLMHLNPAVVVNNRYDGFHAVMVYGRGDAIYLYDSMLLFLAAAFGAYAGALALWQAHNWLRKRLPQVVAATGLAGIMLLTALGVYIGRFGRWNSWDALLHPAGVLSDLWAVMHDPVLRQRLGLVLLTIVIFQVVSLAVARSLKRG